jgi:hypothetical protein
MRQTAIALLMLLPVGVFAGEGITSWKLDLGMSSVYDNNILRYSDKYVTRFDNREDAGRFHINTRDDLILANSIRGSVTAKIFGSLNTVASLDYRRRTYTHNPVKDWSSVAVSLRQDFSKLFAAQVGYSYIPEFYVRHYRDDDWVRGLGYIPETFQPYGFKKDELSSWIQYSIVAGTRVRALFSYMRYFYNDHFTEYDCRNYLGGVELYQTLFKRLKLNGAFEVVYSRGDGNIDMDPSYDEDTFVLGAEYDLPKLFGRSNNIGVDGEYSRRFYTSRHFLELDPNHAGRADHDYRVTVAYTFSLLDNLDLGLTYAWHRRDTETSATQNAEYLSDEKDYRQYQIAFDVKYSLSFSPGE